MLLKVNLRKLEDLWLQSAISLRMRRSSETFPRWSGLTTAQCPCAQSVGGEKWKKWYHGTLRMFKVQDQSFNEIWSLQSIGLIEIKGFLKIIVMLEYSDVVSLKSKRKMMQIFSKVSGDFTCGDCGWPLCSRQCQETETHRKECKFFVQRNSKVSVNVAKVLTILLLSCTRCEWPASVFPTVCTMRSFPWEFSC